MEAEVISSKVIPIHVIVTALSVTILAITALLWLMSTFETKVDYADDKHGIEARFDRQKDFLLKMDDKIDHIQTDITYIKGSLNK